MVRVMRDLLRWCFGLGRARSRSMCTSRCSDCAQTTQTCVRRTTAAAQRDSRGRGPRRCGPCLRAGLCSRCRHVSRRRGHVGPTTGRIVCGHSAPVRARGRCFLGLSYSVHRVACAPRNPIPLRPRPNTNYEYTQSRRAFATAAPVPLPSAASPEIAVEALWATASTQCGSRDSARKRRIAALTCAG